MNMLSLLDGNGFIKLNKALNHYLGTSTAIILAELISEYNYWKKLDRLTEEGYFYSTIDNIWAETSIKKDTQITSIKKLSDLGVITCIRGGYKGQRYFTIHEDVLIQVVLKAQQSFEKQEKKYKPLILKNAPEKSENLDFGKSDVVDFGKSDVVDFGKSDVNNNNVNNNKEIKIYTTQPVVSYKSCDPFQTTTKVQLEREKVHKRKRRLALVEEQINEKVTAPVSETVTERLSDIDGATARENKRQAEEAELQKEIKTKKSIRNNKKKARMKIAKEKTSNPEILSLLETYLDNNYEAHNYVIPDSAWRLSLDKLFSFSHDDKKIIQIIKDNIASCNRSFYCTDKAIKNQASFDNTAHFKTHKALHDLTEEELQEFDSKLARNDDGTYLSF